MREPQGLSGTWTVLVAVAILACVVPFVFREPAEVPQVPPEPEPEVTSQRTSVPVSLHLSGRVLASTDPTNRPEAGDLPFAEGQVLVEQCPEAGRCAAEFWSGEGGQEVVLFIDEQSIRVHRSVTNEELSPDFRFRWRVIRGQLAECLGDPLSDRPATDPGGLRQLRFESGRWWWQLRMSGENRCLLSGTLLLDAHRDRVDTHGLFVDGVAWHTGGREKLGVGEGG